MLRNDLLANHCHEIVVGGLCPLLSDNLKVNCSNVVKQGIRMRIECPECHFTQNVREDKIPPGTVNARCPQCGARFKLRGAGPEAAFGQEGGRAEARATQPAKAVPVEAKNDVSAETEEEYAARRKAAAQAYAQAARSGAPVIEWEARWRGSPISAFGKTLFHILTRPSHFFGLMPYSSRLLAPVLFSVIIWVLFAVGIILIVKFQPSLYFRPSPDNAHFQEQLRATPWWWYFFSLPAGFIFSSFLVTLISHGSLRMLSPASADLRVTARVVAYANASWILFFVPQAGALLGAIAFWVLLCVGLRAAHKLTLTIALSATAACLFVQMLIALLAISSLVQSAV